MNMKKEKTVNEHDARIREYMDIINLQLREPTTNIFASLPLLAENINKHYTEKAMHTLNTVYQKTYDILKTINNMSMTAKLLSQSSFSDEIIDFSSLIKTAFYSAKAVLPNKCTIKIDTEEGLFIKGNASLLSIGLFNLISNSIDYKSDEDVRISVSLRKENNRCILTYKDNSIGIKNEIINDIYKPYFSANPYNDGEITEGMGLGLFMLDQGVKLSKGTIFLHSEFSKGVNYVISIPQADIEDSDVVRSQPKNFMLNRYSELFVQLSKHCILPDLV